MLVRQREQASPQGQARADLETLYREQAPAVWRAIRRFGVQPHDVEDVAQEAFLIAHRNLASFDGRSSLRTWMYGIAWRCAVNFRRKERKHEDHQVEEKHSDLAAQPAPQFDAVEQKQARQLLDELLEQLPQLQRAALVLYELENVSVAEIAEIMDCPAPTIYSRLRLARAAITALAEQRISEQDTPS